MSFNATTKTVTFTPDNNYTGAASFDYQVTDGKVSATGHVAVTVTPIQIIRGTNGPNFLVGGPGSQLLLGLGANDRLNGGLGDDFLTGGAGADTFIIDGSDVTGTAVDTITDLNFAEGDSIALLNFGRGTFAGFEGGNDLFVNEKGTGTVIDALIDIRELAEATTTVKASQSGADLLVTVIDTNGDKEVVRLSGLWNAYDDLLRNGPEVNELRGGNGPDVLDAGPGNQILKGLGGNDTLIGGPGDDLMTGGTGADVFQFSGRDIAEHQHDNDTISDLNFAEGDKLVFSGYQGGTFGAHSTAGGSSVTIDFGSCSGRRGFDIGQHSRTSARNDRHPDPGYHAGKW